ncbi:MAG: hypothetical protein AB1813_15450 [Verrucomicrobiota bacterium]
MCPCPFPCCGRRGFLLLLGSLLVYLLSAGGAEPSAKVPEGYRLLYEQKFDSAEALKSFVMTDPSAWQISGEGAASALELKKQSQYQPPVRSPVNIAMLADRVFGDFILEADLLQTSREYGHRDMCLFFGITSPSKFYYVHMATAADDHAHNIFIVHDQPRTKIAKETTRGVDWGSQVWHKVRLERQGAVIKVFYDNMSQPIMQAEDATFQSGYIGFGSFDDTGKIDNIRIWGRSAEKKKADFFKAHSP